MTGQRAQKAYTCGKGDRERDQDSPTAVVLHEALHPSYKLKGVGRGQKKAGNLASQGMSDKGFLFHILDDSSSFSTSWSGSLPRLPPAHFWGKWRSQEPSSESDSICSEQCAEESEYLIRGPGLCLELLSVPFLQVPGLPGDNQFILDQWFAPRTSWGGGGWDQPNAVLRGGEGWPCSMEKGSSSRIHLGQNHSSGGHSYKRKLGPAPPGAARQVPTRVLLSRSSVSLCRADPSQPSWEPPVRVLTHLPDLGSQGRHDGKPRQLPQPLPCPSPTKQATQF